VQKFLNLYAAAKCDEFIRSIARHRKICWLCDDDIFLMSPKAVDYMQQEFAVPNTASVSFRPRNWWRFALDGKEIEPSGSYCLAVNREIFWTNEHLTLAPADGNTHASTRGKPRRYDTFDRANEILLRRGYRCAILPKQEQDECITGFSGMSGAVMLLNYFRTPEQLLDYHLSPSKDRWSGSVLFGTLHALLAVCTIQECYQKITGKTYPLPALPSRSALEKIKRDRLPYLRADLSFRHMEEAEERLRKTL
jgi:hypothetical protein